MFQVPFKHTRSKAGFARTLIVASVREENKAAPGQRIGQPREDAVP
jgi:hypothetical protein